MKNDALKALQSLLRGQLRNARRRKKTAPLVIAVLVISIFGISQFLEQPNAPIPGKGTELSCDISKVYDGDTVTASCKDGKLKIRVWGIDAPEMGQKPWGRQSRDLLRGMMPRSEAKLQVVDKDRYGRIVARLYDGNRDLGLAMVRQGRAIVYEHFNNSKTYRKAQAQAKWEKLGIWSKPGNHQKPAAWRKVNARG